MKSRTWMAGVVAAGLMAAPVAMPGSAGAAGCVSGAEVRQQVSTFVHSLRDDVSRDERAAVRAALEESVRTARGEKAETPAERRGLGREISALARTKKDAETQLERKAITTQIHALQEQRRQDEVTEEDVEQVESDVAAMRRAIIGRVDTTKEKRQVAAFTRRLMTQLGC